MWYFVGVLSAVPAILFLLLSRWMGIRVKGYDVEKAAGSSSDRVGRI